MNCPIYIFILVTSNFGGRSIKNAGSAEQTYCPRMVHKPDSRRHPSPISKLVRSRPVLIPTARLQNENRKFPQSNTAMS